MARPFSASPQARIGHSANMGPAEPLTLRIGSTGTHSLDRGRARGGRCAPEPTAIRRSDPHGAVAPPDHQKVLRTLRPIVRGSPGEAAFQPSDCPFAADRK